MALGASLAPYVFTGLLGWIYVRRIAGNFGRQPWQPKRTAVRLVLLSLALLGLEMAAVYVPGAGAAVTIGLACGAVLALFALRYTHAEIADGVRYYTPNPWIGGALSLLLVGRLAWRMFNGGGAFAQGAAQAGQNASPLTLGIAATLVAFYVVNRVGLYLQMRKLSAALPDATP